MVDEGERNPRDAGQRDTDLEERHGRQTRRPRRCGVRVGVTGDECPQRLLFVPAPDCDENVPGLEDRFGLGILTLLSTADGRRFKHLDEYLTISSSTLTPRLTEARGSVSSSLECVLKRPV